VRDPSFAIAFEQRISIATGLRGLIATRGWREGAVCVGSATASTCLRCARPASITGNNPTFTNSTIRVAAVSLRVGGFARNSRFGVIWMVGQVARAVQIGEEFGAGARCAAPPLR